MAEITVGSRVRLAGVDYEHEGRVVEVRRQTGSPVGMDLVRFVDDYGVVHEEKRGCLDLVDEVRAPLNSLVDGERKAAVRDQVRLMASALGLTVSEADADAHAADLLALVAAEKVSGVGNRAVAAHLLTASARRHEESMERIAAALEALARGKGHDEPAQRVSAAVATYSAQHIADLRTLAQEVMSQAPGVHGWVCGLASAKVSGGILNVYVRKPFLGTEIHRFGGPIPDGMRDADLIAWIAATCRAVATRAEAHITSARSLDELVALDLEGARCTP